MTSSRFLFTAFIFFIFSALVIGVATYIFYRLPQKTIWIHNSFLVKDGYALVGDSQKIVFSSGSNTLYGINTKHIEEKTGIQTVNMAIHAGLKTDYILYRTKKVLKKGDIVILPFEYENLTWDGEHSTTRTEYIMTHDRKFLLEELSIYEQISMLLSITPIDLVGAIFSQLREVTEAKVGNGYTSVTLNKNGDETYKAGQKRGIRNEAFEIPLVFRETKALKEIVDFSKWCQKNGVELLLTFPNIMINEIFFDAKYVDFFNELIKYYDDPNC